ncbi:hypothetical protein CJ739_986 [Mariniflexile rhizosphaerae]|uniref:immunity protein Imm33 domain-containing protein n=1 Tax=unclassified Mariniflexile TaxID=2643887 RepID=UPI000CBFDD3F|nr:hypothetical protein [Mariniflexile sp. TRM1-10]AXP80079.1 hypothetical protein CJ739_986 [Mariniflexile sp. TRM1-10]PLB20915.1 MAG: hypothetical protein TRG1_8 [Flavobacteriaceae bacterium FS1-H7996/R]
MSKHNNEIDLINEQKRICKKYGTAFVEAPLNSKIGISDNVLEGVQPINGLRHFSNGDTTGWYIWAGEYSDAPDFFKPLHIKHLNELNSLIMPFLGLEPGYRFLIAEGGDYVDVWEDLSLLDVID